jgi:hypothetical protein
MRLVVFVLYINIIEKNSAYFIFTLTGEIVFFVFFVVQ